MKKVIWIVVSALMVLTTLIAACAPAATPTTPSAPTSPAPTPSQVTPTATNTPNPPTQEQPQTGSASASNKPQYGGTLRLVLNADMTNFDDVVTVGYGPGYTNSLTNENMWTGD